MLVILDRDGVINFESVEYVKSPDEWKPIPGSLKAIAALNAAGHTVVVATNQAGVGRGYYSEATLAAIHHKMKTELAAHGGSIKKIYYCPHHPDEHCLCRKPKPGMLQQIAKDFPQQFNDAVFVGDSLRDLQAGQAAGCRVVLVKTGFGEAMLAEGKIPDDVEVYENLADFVQLV